MNVPKLMWVNIVGVTWPTKNPVRTKHSTNISEWGLPMKLFIYKINAYQIIRAISVSII